MSKLIGGPLHGRDINVCGKYLVVPVSATNRAPKQLRKEVGWIMCRYKLIEFSNGKKFFRFFDGYYTPEVKHE
jgi:hypothetical protein